MNERKELINVAVTRAQNELVVVADTTAVKNLSGDKTNAISDLIFYARENGKKLPINDSHKNLKAKDLSNNSEYERLFFKTISQVLSVIGTFEFERNVQLKKIFPEYSGCFQNYYEHAECDGVLWKVNNGLKFPVLIFELDGDEHYTNASTQKRDAQKEEICKTHGIKLFRIPNHYVSHYTLIKDFITNSTHTDAFQRNLF